MKEANFKCNHCSTSFVHEDRYLKHKCKQMQRKEDLETPLGQAAWLYYQYWMKANHRFVPEVKSFLHSKFFSPFMRFAKFVKEVRIPDPELYIELMIELDMMPAMWTSDIIYVAYIEYLDKKIPPIRNAKITIETLFNLAEDMKCDITEIFNHLDPHEVIQLIRQRKISPWLLLRSRKFNEFYHNRLTKDNRMLLETIVIPKRWAEKLKNSAEDVKKIDQFVEALGL